MKLGLGTVQFGVNYGISNAEGQTSADEVAEILAIAGRNGINIIDTAALYGTSEEVLGMVLPVGHQFKLVTKTPRFDAAKITSADASLLEQTFAASLQKLRCPAIYGLMVHNAHDLLCEDGHLLMEKVLELRQQGLVEKTGVSIYTAEQIDRILDRFTIDLIQVPVNVFDQRLLASGHLAKLKAAGVEIHARSVFLQGLLLMEPDQLPPFFDTCRGELVAYREMLNEYGLTPVDAALGFVTGLDEIDCVICGVNNHRQLEEICTSYKPLPAEFFRRFALDQDEILNPALWRL